MTRLVSLIVAALLLLFALPARAEEELESLPADPATTSPSQSTPPPATPTQVSGKPDEKPSAARVRTAHNALYVELLGNGLLYSVNYERIFGDSGFSVRVGTSIVPGGSSDRPLGAFGFTLPMLANYYVGGVNHKAQLGAGVTFMHLTLSTDPNDGRPTGGRVLYVAEYVGGAVRGGDRNEAYLTLRSVPR